MSAKDKKYDIDLLSLKEGVDYEFDYRIGREFFESKENDDVLGSDVDVHLTVRRRRDAYELLFECDGTLAVACDRCLDPVNLEVGEDYEVRLVYGEEYDDSADDVIVIPEQWTRFDVSGLIYDTLLLTIPLRCVHPEGECNAAMRDALRRHGGEDASGAEATGEQDIQ